MDHGLREVDLRLRIADQRHGLHRRDRDGQGRGVGKPDVLAREDHEAAGDEAGVLPRLHHPREVVQSRIDIAAADALDQGAGDVVVLVAVPVVAHGRAVDGLLYVSHRDLGGRAGLGGGRSCLEGGQRPARVTAGQARELLERVTVDREPRCTEAASVGDGAFEKHAYAAPPRAGATSGARCVTAAAR